MIVYVRLLAVGYWLLLPQKSQPLKAKCQLLI